jgi:hypothetical protein
VALVSKMVRLFWRDLEVHEPGIDSLHLSEDVARRWKQRLSEVRHGRQRIGQPRQDLAANLIAVRAFYADLTHWALEDPARRAGWVAPSPVTSRDLAGMGKQRQRAVARTHQRTRELSPVLPQLVVRADAQKRSAQALLAAAVAAGPGEVFESGDMALRRLPPARDGGRPDLIFARAIDGSGPRINVTLLDDYAFWAWVSIEVLRHTAMRVREMLELTHRSFVAYTLPGTITPHDFRRIFATDAAAAGLPVHILAKILGHESIATTQIYVAIYDEDVIDHHRGFIARRRSLRPSEEYREPTDAEWDEFIGHFAKRKVELGTCGRAYGTRCHGQSLDSQTRHPTASHIARPDIAAPCLAPTRVGPHDHQPRAASADASGAFRTAPGMSASLFTQNCSFHSCVSKAAGRRLSPGGSAARAAAVGVLEERDPGG